MACEETNGGRRAHSLGFCTIHYRRWRSGQAVDAPISATRSVAHQSERSRSLRSTPYCEVSASASGGASHAIGTTGTTGAQVAQGRGCLGPDSRQCARWQRVCCEILLGCPLLRRLLLRGW